MSRGNGIGVSERGALARRAVALIGALTGGKRDDCARDALLTRMLVWQASAVPAYGKLLAARGTDPSEARHPGDLPALPTDVFRHARIASHDEREDLRRFRTSGTSGGARGVHALRDLSLYDLAARTAARHALFPEDERMRLVILAPSEVEDPRSSLSYMLARFERWFGRGHAHRVMRGGRLRTEALAAALEQAIACDAPVALLGTSFAFVHAEDGLSNRRFRLPAGSRVMQTGGFKGRAREVAPDRLRRDLSRRYGVPESHVVGEYGMTELSSQMYETSLIAPTLPRRLWIPPWMRAVPVDPDTLAPVAQGEVGILRLDDVANVGSVSAIQTSDLAREDEHGLRLLGRAPGATPRGCSLAVDAALGEER